MRYIRQQHDALFENRQRVNERERTRHWPHRHARDAVVKFGARYEPARSANQACIIRIMEHSIVGSANAHHGNGVLAPCISMPRLFSRTRTPPSRIVDTCANYRNTTLVCASIRSLIAVAFSFTGTTICRILKPHHTSYSESLKSFIRKARTGDHDL
jgi:hypothetical protein